MPSYGMTVICNNCGKRLRGTPSVLGPRAVHINKHKRPDGTRCRGYLFTNHRPPQKA